MTKIAHLSSVHKPGDVRILHKECGSLAKAGYETYFIVPAPADAHEQGVTICALTRPRNRWERLFSTDWQLFQRARKLDASVYHFHDVELIPIGILLKLMGKRVIYDVHESVPKDILHKSYILRPFRRPASWLVGLLQRLGTLFFDRIICATPAIAGEFPATKALTIQNYPLLEEIAFQDNDHSEPYSKRPRRVIYAGGLNEARGAREMVEAMGHLPDSETAEFLVLGEVSPPELQETLERLPGAARCRFMGHVNRPLMLQELGRARLGLVLFHPLPNHVEAQPNKLFEYMAAGIPVVASDFPLWRKLVEEIGAGLLVNPLDPRAIASAIAYLLDHEQEAQAMGQRGREAVLMTRNWQAEADKLTSAYQRLTKHL